MKASSTQAGGILTELAATDGNKTTRWGSDWTDDQWIYVDLGQTMTIGRVLLRWENAYGKSFKIQSSEDALTWVDLLTISNGSGGVDDLALSGTGRYVRMLGIARGTDYGYSLWEFEVYADPPPNGPPVQSENQTINLRFPVQGLAYAKVNVSPEPLSVSPLPPEGNGTPSVRNPAQPVVYQLTFRPNTLVTISKNQFTGSSPNTDIVLSTVDYKGAPLSAASLTALALNNSTWDVVVKATGPTGNGNNPPANWIPDPYKSPAPVPGTGTFSVVGPSGGAMITNTRRPRLTWEPVPGATKYDVYLNLSRTDYDWMAPGSLLDRYTLLGTVESGTSYVVPQDLPDRWTYKWYVVATDAGGKTRTSGVGTFSIYLPTLTAVDDGVPVINGCRDLNKNGRIEPYEDWRNAPAVRVADLMSRMSLHQKAMQLFFNTQEYPEAGFGFGPFDPSDLLRYQKLAAQTQLGIPNIVLGDTIHGYKTVFPTQPGLAATRDLQTVWEVADVQRRESLAVGARGTLSPLAEVGTKVLYPRIQEGCGEDADFAAGMTRAMIVGLQGGPEVNPQSMMITTKHWPSQGGGGETGMVYDGTTIWYHMRPWHAALECGVSSIMPGYGGSWLLSTMGYGASDDPGILSFLRDNMGYRGVICTDWLPSGAWTRACTNEADVMGGADPAAMGSFETDVPLSRINDAVSRVLDLKFRLGIFEDPYRSHVNGVSEWHTSEKVALVRNAAVQSLTLLKNNGALPLRSSAGTAIMVDGARADDPSCMVTWRSDFHETDYGCPTIYRAIADRAAKEGITVYGPRARTPKPVPAGTTLAAAVVVVGESYFTHGTFWDKDSPYLPDDPIGPPHDLTDAPQYALIQQYRSQGIPTIVVCILPRPYVLTNVNAIADALMVVYRPGDEGGTAIAETLFGDHLPMGKTPWQLPRSLDQIGIDDAAHWQDQPDKWDLPYDMGATSSELAAIRSAIASGSRVEPIYGDPLFQFGSGLQGFGLIDATPPRTFSLLTPSNGQEITGVLPAFTWEASSDGETGIQRYEVYVDGDLVATLRKGTSYTLSGMTLGNGAHSWQVKAYNWANGVTGSSVSQFTVNDTIPPAPFRTLIPPDGSSVQDVGGTTFFWEQSSDGGTGIASYTRLIDGTTAAVINPGVAISTTTNLALGKTAYGSSTSYGTPGAAVDGSITSRWSSDWANVSYPDAEWFTVDLGAVYSIKEVILEWENAYAEEYLVQTSLDNNSWITLYHKKGGTGGTDDLRGLSGVGRFVRMQGIKRATAYGYSLWEFQIMGVGTEQATVSLPVGSQHTWRVRATDGAGNSALNANGAFTLVSGLAPLQQWLQEHFGTVDANDPLAGDGATPANDGVPNLIKYSLGLDPRLPATASGLPTVAVSNSAVSLSFNRMKNATDITYRVETSSDLANWTEIWNSAAVPYAGGESASQRMNVEDPTPLSRAPNQRRFIRLKITRP